MIISELEIRNFRSINEDGITIEFSESLNFYSFVGPNNSGKTNILHALALVLGIRSGKFYNYNISPPDFYNQDVNNPIFIKLTLRDPIKYRNVYQQECYINGFIFEAKVYTRGESKGEIHFDHYCFGKNAKGNAESPLLDFEKIYKAKNKITDEGVENKKRPLLARDHLYKLSSFTFLDIEYLSSFFRVSGYGPLGKLFQIYKDDFLAGRSFYKNKGGKQKKEISSINAFIETARVMRDILKTDKLEEIEKNLSKNISEYLGLTTEQKTAISLGLPQHEEIFENMVKLKIKESPELTSLVINKLGSGYLSLFRLAVLKTLAEMKQKKTMFYIIEEPEIYLHTHLRRFFYKTLKLLAEEGNQIIFSTHSQDFVNIDDYASVVRIHKTNAVSSSCYQVSPNLNLDFDKIHRKVKRKGNEELFFAKHALLVEGQDDKVVLDELLDKKGIDCDAKSISVIDCDSKSQIPDYINLCKSLNISYFTIFDTDKNNTSSATDTAKILEALNNDSTKFKMLPNTLEHSLGTTKKDRDNWKNLLSIIDPFDYETMKVKYPDIANAIETFSNQL